MKRRQLIKNLGFVGGGLSLAAIVDLFDDGTVENNYHKHSF